MEEELVMIPRKRLASLLRSELKLDALEYGGVDNWISYDLALSEPDFGDGKSYNELNEELSDDDLVNQQLERIKNRRKLRPISSMTKEEIDKLFEILDINKDGEDEGEWIKVNDIGIIRLFTQNGKDFYELDKAIKYLDSIGIDFREE